MKLYQKLAQMQDAYHRCIDRGNSKWKLNHEEAIRKLVADNMPKGSGFDNGTQFDFERKDCLIFSTAFHHMNDDGYYDGWSEHKVAVTPSLAFEINVRVTGIDRNGIKEYIAEVFRADLTKEIETVLPFAIAIP